MRIVVVGGAGFVGSAVSRMLVAEHGATVLVIDKLTPQASLASLAPISASPRYAFRKADICDVERTTALLHAFAPDAVIHAAAESRIATSEDRAFDRNFIASWRLIEAVHAYWLTLPELRRTQFRFTAVTAADAIGSPAPAATASASELVLSWNKTYGLPTIVARAATAFGPCQFPAATVPSAILSALDGTTVSQEGPVRDWIYVDDLAAGLVSIVKSGTPGAQYSVTGRGRAAPAELARRIARLVERHGSSKSQGFSLAEAVTNQMPVVVRGELAPLDGARLAQDTSWRPAETLDSALSKTVRWYLANEAWWRPLDEARTGGEMYGLLRIA